MASPCKGCTRRQVGCHNVETCQVWKTFVEEQKEERAKRPKPGYYFSDWERHVKRRAKRKLPRM